MIAVRSVLYVVAFSFPGVTGTPLHAMGIAKSMQENGIEVNVVQFQSWPLFKSTKDNWDGIPIYRVARPFWSQRLLKLLRSLKPDIVHAHHILASLFSLQPCKQLQIPLIYECHSFWRDEITESGKPPRPVQRYAAWKEKEVFKDSTHIVALSEKMKSTHVAEMGIPPEKVTVIYPGVKSDWIDRKVREKGHIPGLKENDFVIMYCGNFAPYQGIDLLLGSLTNIIDSFPRLKIVLVGAREDENKVKKEQWGDFNGSVVYLGRYPHEAMPSLFSRADALVIPRPNTRICWTMPRKFGEYLSAGKPLLVTDISDHRKILEHFNCGIVTTCTEDSIADGIIKLLGLSDNDLESMKENSIRAAKAWFDWEKQMARFIKLYNFLAI